MGNRLMKSMKSIYLTLALVLASSQLFAAPAIDTASGAFSNGGTITVSGTGFGATGPNVVFYDSFEKGTTGNLVSIVTGSADIGEWDGVYNSGGPDNTYSTLFAHSGTKSLLTDYRTYWGGGPYTIFPNVQNSDLLVSFWVMIPVGRDVPGTNGGEGVNWKLFWTGDRNDSFPWGSDMAIECVGSTTCTNSEGIAALDDGGAPERYQGVYYTPYFTKGVWRRVTVAMKNATSGAYVWHQEVSAGGYQIGDSQTSVVTAHSDDPWNFLAVPGFGRQDTNSLVFTDDVYIATGAGARARVEIGNASTYTACTNLTLLTPTSWGDTSVTATVRQGSFADEESAYLYVVHADGTMNANGYPVTIGGGAPAQSAGGRLSGSLSGGGVMR